MCGVLLAEPEQIGTVGGATVLRMIHAVAAFVAVVAVMAVVETVSYGRVRRFLHSDGSADSAVNRVDIPDTVRLHPDLHDTSPTEADRGGQPREQKEFLYCVVGSAAVGGYSAHDAP